MYSVARYKSCLGAPYFIHRYSIHYAQSIYASCTEITNVFLHNVYRSLTVSIIKII